MSLRQNLLKLRQLPALPGRPGRRNRLIAAQLEPSSAKAKEFETDTCRKSEKPTHPLSAIFPLPCKAIYNMQQSQQRVGDYHARSGKAHDSPDSLSHGRTGAAGGALCTGRFLLAVHTPVDALQSIVQQARTIIAQHVACSMVHAAEKLYHATYGLLFPVEAVHAGLLFSYGLRSRKYVPGSNQTKLISNGFLLLGFSASFSFFAGCPRIRGATSW